VRGFILVPTRELAMQVAEAVHTYGRGRQIRVLPIYGGQSIGQQLRALSRGVDVVVATPGRALDHIGRGTLNLASVKCVVLDEADEMLDMGFREDLEEILEATPAERKSLLFSATMPKPIVALAKRYQKDALRISTVSESPGHGDITYQAVAVSPNDIENAVINLLRFHEAETAILFCATRDNVRHLHSSLTERGFAAVALSGEHSQKERNAALQALRDGRARICVATDVAARGIDIPSLSLVIHVETPRDAEILQHRSGRTGRAGRKGVAVLVVPYPRRRRVDGMLKMARVLAEWVPVPSAEMIRERDRERMLADIAKPIEASDGDRALAEKIVEIMSPIDLAVALVYARRQGTPEPEDLNEQSAGDGPPRQERREGFDDVSWFRMDIGRRQNADPRWILPLLCRRGHITRNEIGAIRITANETFFQVPTAVEAKFRAALKRTGTPGSEDENGITIEPSLEAPRESGGNDGPRPGPGRDNAMGRRRGPPGENRGGGNEGRGPGRPTLHRKGPPARRKD